MDHYSNYGSTLSDSSSDDNIDEDPPIPQEVLRVDSHGTSISGSSDDDFSSQVTDDDAPTEKTTEDEKQEKIFEQNIQNMGKGKMNYNYEFNDQSSMMNSKYEFSDKIQKQRKRSFSSIEEEDDDNPMKTMGKRSFLSIEEKDDDDDDNGSPMSKMVKKTKKPTFMDNKAQKMMERMGYKVGHGLGKHAQGRVDPIEMSKQRGRRGLGLHIQGLEAADLEWNSSLEVISVTEEVKWLKNENYIRFSTADFETWVVTGPKKLVIDDETNFCDPGLLRNVLSSKSVFDELEEEEMRKARLRSNPFETIRGAIFLNRAAMKMANMDKVFDFMFTNPCDKNGKPMVGPDDLLYFADVCAGPGGFSEYVLYRKKWHCKGFGFTLKNENDFRLADFYAGPCETFEPYYGINGADGDGNVFDPKNISAFTEFVMEQTFQKGVHFMMADGGFSVEGQENIQEILSKQLYLCQCLVALNILRSGGHFVCKLFDLFTPFSVGLVYLMYKSFSKISIHKPNTSRPANSERYIICKWKHDNCNAIKDYMFHINNMLWEMPESSNIDILEIVPMSVLTQDETFFNYIVESNNSLGERQVINLVKIAAFCRDTTLNEPTQADMRRECLKYWEIPDKARTAPPRCAPDMKCEELMKQSRSNILSLMNSKEVELQLSNLEETFESIYDWHCCVIGSNKDRREVTFFLGLGRKRVYKWENSRWHALEKFPELSPDTLVLGELVYELRGEGKSQRKITAFHIIDAIFLGGIDVSKLHLTERYTQCRKFARALYKPSRSDLIRVRAKKAFDLENITSIFNRLEFRVIKGNSGMKRLVFTLDNEEGDDMFYLPGGIMFFKATGGQWKRHLSKTTKHKYYFCVNEDSHYDSNRPTSACAPTEACFRKRIVWWWEGVIFNDAHGSADKGKVQKETLVKFVEKRK